MNIYPLFSMGVGFKPGEEYLEFARKLFVDHKDALKTIDDNGHTTTLEAYGVKEIGDKSDVLGAVKQSPMNDFIVQAGVDFLQAEGYDTSAYEYGISNAWLNEMKSGAEHKMHAHNGNIVSGCYYVDLPESSEMVCFQGFLPRFDRAYIDIREYTSLNSESWTLPAKVGSFMCWHSYVQHGVPVQKFKGIRRSIAFDIIATRKK